MPSEAERKRKEKWYREQALRHGQTVGSVPGITGGGWTPNTNPMGAVNGTPFVWSPPTAAAGTAPPAAPPAPASAPAQPPPVTGGYAGSTTAPFVTTTAVPGPWSIPGSAPPANTGGGPAPSNQSGQGDDPLGPGSNWYWSPDEYWRTLGAFTGTNDPSGLRSGWYGSSGQYLGQGGGQGIGNFNNPGAVYWAGDDRVYNDGYSQGSNIAFGNANYQGGQRDWRQVAREQAAQGPQVLSAQLDEAQARLNRALNGQGGAGGGAMGVMGLRRKIKGLQAALGGRYGAAGGGVSDSPSPNWMGQMVGFNP